MEESLRLRNGEGKVEWKEEAEGESKKRKRRGGRAAAPGG
jgi:hypothetical protein